MDSLDRDNPGTAFAFANAVVALHGQSQLTRV
jgi:hypothetical protein